MLFRSGDITATAQDGDTVIVDGSAGVIVVNPTAGELAMYRDKQRAYEVYMVELAQLKDQKAVTGDGHEVILSGNIGNPKDVEGVNHNGGMGVGLYRSEFLYMDADTMPSEEKQFAAYKTVVEDFRDREGVIIRTLDIGGDKKLPYLPLEEEMNPFLGLRAVRLAVDRKSVV